MVMTGIIAEFNPLHSGHKYIIDSAKNTGNAVACVISGNFTQRGDVAVISKQKRTEAALRCGADLVAELPVLWSMSTAQNFALGAVWQLYNLGCDEIIFGSECGNIDTLKKTAKILMSDEFSAAISKEIKSGITFAAARQKAADTLGVPARLLENANDNLGLEYICAAEKLKLSISFRCIKRVGAAHDSNEISPSHVSGALLREKILSGNIGFAERYMPQELRGFINSDNVADIKKIEIAILAALRSSTREAFSVLPDISEGIENKLFFSSRVATSLDELYKMIKTKRYTMARVRRLVLSAFLGFDNDFFMKTPPYIRILGFSNHGAEKIKVAHSEIPIVTQISQIKKLNKNALRVFNTECRASDLYALAFSKPPACGMEYTSKLLKLECLK